MTYGRRVFVLWGGYFGIMLPLIALLSFRNGRAYVDALDSFSSLNGSAGLAINLGMLFLFGFLAGGSAGLLMRHTTSKRLSGFSVYNRNHLAIFGLRTPRITWAFYRHGLGIDRDGSLLK